MPYRLVKGEFHLFYEGQIHVGLQPDGDSLWFAPNNPALLDDVAGRGAKFNDGGFVQLRFEGIDALELHYKGAHQYAPASIAARDSMLLRVGFQTVEYASSSDIPKAVRSASPHPVSGYILTRSIDTYGRPVSFVFTEKGREIDGREVWLDVTRLNRSLNARLINDGYAYPAFYAGLPVDLRNRLTALADRAWSYDLGVWAVDDTMVGANIPDLATLELLALWPKLFRRLVTYFRDGNSGLAAFDVWLRAEPRWDDELWIISRGESANLHDVIRINGDRLRMEYWPEDLVIVPG